MANAIEAYKEAWNAYSKNPKPYVMNGLALLLVTVIVVPVILIASFLPSLLDLLGIAGITAPVRIVLILASVILSMLLGVVIAVVGKSFYGVCNDIAEGTAVEWHSLYGHARRSWKTLAGIAVLQMVAVTVLAMLMIAVPTFLLGMALGPEAAVLISILAILVMMPVVMLVAMVFEPAYPIALTEYAGVFGSIGAGLGFIRRNPAQFLIYIIVSALVDVLNFVPLAQQLLTTPLSSAALLIFYKKDKEERGKRGKKK